MVFHGRRDLGTIQTYVAHGGRGAGDAVGKDELLRVPCDLDLAGAEDREEAEHMFAEQAGALRDALVGADTVLDIWREPLEDLAHDHIRVDRRIQLDLRLPAHRLLPTALIAPEKQIVVTAVCGARTLAEGRPPMGIACAQQDVARVYPLPDDPERCLEDFLSSRPSTPTTMAEQLGRQEASVAALPRALRRRLPSDRLTILGPAASCADTRPPSSIGFGVFVFLGISRAAGARAGGDRRRARRRRSSVARAEARGDADAVLGKTPACAAQPACAPPREAFVGQAQAARATSRSCSYHAVGPAAADARRSAPAASPGAPGKGLPVVQCVRVQRDGPLTGARVVLLSISAPIKRESDCPTEPQLPAGACVEIARDAARSDSSCPCSPCSR